MGGRLAKAWIRLTLVWWAAVAIAWAFSDVRIGAAVKLLTGRGVAVNPANSGHLALSVLRMWSLPVALAAAVAASAGWLIAWVAHRLMRRDRDNRVRPGSEWRGLRISLGALEQPAWLPDRQEPFTAEVSPALALRINRLDPVHRAVLNEVLGYLAAHPEAYVGAGHHGTLLDHTLHVLERLPRENDDALALIATAAHDAGKVLAWQRKESGRGGWTGKVLRTLGLKRQAQGEWERKGNHDDFGGLLVSALPAAARLSESELRVLVTALRFAHKREKTPLLHDTAERVRVASIQDAVTEADREATAIEKKLVLAEVDRPKLLETAFLTALPGMLFQVHGIAKGAKAAAWRKGARVYFSEPRLREVIGETLRTLNADAAAAWQETRQKGKVVQQTLDLLDFFRGKGWLVEEIEGVRADPPLWNVMSGTKSLSGIIIVDVPEALHYMLPANTHYELTVTGALLNGGEIPSARKKREEPAPESQTPSSAGAPAETLVAAGNDPAVSATVPAQEPPPAAEALAPALEPPPQTPPPAAQPAAPAPPNRHGGGRAKGRQGGNCSPAPPANHQKPSTSSKAAILALMSGNAIGEVPDDDEST